MAGRDAFDHASRAGGERTTRRPRVVSDQPAEVDLR